MDHRLPVYSSLEAKTFLPSDQHLSNPTLPSPAPGNHHFTFCNINFKEFSYICKLPIHRVSKREIWLFLDSDLQTFWYILKKKVEIPFINIPSYWCVISNLRGHDEDDILKIFAVVIAYTINS